MNNNRKIYLLILLSFLVGTSQFVIVGVLDKIATSVNVSVATAGQLITVFALASAIGTPIITIIASRFDQREQLLLALVIFVTGIFITLLPFGFGVLIFSRIIVGIGTGFFIVTAYAIAAKLAPMGGQQGKVMSNIIMGFGASLVFGVPLGRIVTAAYDWQMVFWGIGVLGMLGIFFSARMMPSLDKKVVIPISQQLVLLKKAKVLLAFGVTFCVFTSYSAVNTYITPLLSAIEPMNDEEMSSMLFALGIASLIGSKLGGFLADWMGTSRILVASVLIHIFALALLPMVSGSMSIVMILILIWMIATWTFGPTQIVNLVSMSPEASVIMLSLNASFVQLGFAAGAALGGVAMSHSSVMAISWVGAAAVILAIMLIAFSSTMKTAE